MTTSPLVSMSGSTGGGAAGAGGGPGVAGAAGAGGAPGAGGAATGGAGGGGATSLPITSSRKRTWAASLALGSSCKYFSKYVLAFSSCFPFSYETATLKRKAGYGFLL